MSDEFNDADFDGFDFDTDGADPDKMESVLTVNKPGRYHMEVANVKPRLELVNDKGEQKSPDFLITATVLHSVPGQSSKGSLFFHNLRVAGPGGAAISETSRDATIRFLVGMGVLILKGKQVIDPETGTTKVNFKTLVQRLQGRQFIANVKYVPPNGNYPEKWELPFGEGVFQVDNPAVADVPKCRAALKLIGKEHCAPAEGAAAGGGGNGKAAPSKKEAKPKEKQPETAAAGTGAADDDLSDL